MGNIVHVVRIGIALVALVKLVTGIEIIVEQVENLHLHKQRLFPEGLNTHQP